MNKITSFILGALLMFVVMLSVNIVTEPSANNQSEANSSASSESVLPPVFNQIENTIAFVNNDIGISGTNVNVATSLINSMPTVSSFEIETTTYNDAMAGLDNGKYAAYVVFDANYSQSLMSVATNEIPDLAKITLKLNPDLSEDQLLKVEQQLFLDYNYIKESVTYMYIAYLLDIVHSTQNDIDTVIENEEYMNAVAASVASYSSEVASQLSDYVKNPPKTEVELNLSSLQDLEDKDIELVADASGVDADKITSSLATEQAQLETTINSKLLKPNAELSPLELVLTTLPIESSSEADQILSSYLTDNIATIDQTNQVLNIANQTMSEYKTLLEVMPDLETLDILSVIDVIWNSSINGDQSGIGAMSADEQYIYQAANAFMYNYTRWYTAANGIEFEACNADYLSECMTPFNSSYQNNIDSWLSSVNDFTDSYNQLKARLPEVSENIESIKAQLINPSSVDGKYMSIILANDNDPAANYQNTLEYCKGKNAVSGINKFSCGLLAIVSNYQESLATIDEYNTTVESSNTLIKEHNEQLKTTAEAQNSAVTSANSDTLETLTEYNQNQLSSAKESGTKLNEKIATLQSNINQTVDETNQSKDEYIVNLNQQLDDYIMQLNDQVGSVLEQQVEDRTSLYQTANQYNTDYAETNKNYLANIDMLSTFGNLLRNTRNAGEANYYLYDFIVNPLKVVLRHSDSSESETEVIVSEDSDQSAEKPATEKNQYILLALGLIIITLLAIYLVYHNDGDEDDEED